MSKYIFIPILASNIHCFIFGSNNKETQISENSLDYSGIELDYNDLEMKQKTENDIAQKVIMNLIKLPFDLFYLF